MMNSEISDAYPSVITLIRAIHTTIQLNDYIRSRYLIGKDEFSSNQMINIYENIDLLEDNSLVLNQALQAIKTLLTELKNLKEAKLNEFITNTVENADFINNNLNLNFTKEINYDK